MDYNQNDKCIADIVLEDCLQIFQQLANRSDILRSACYSAGHDASKGVCSLRPRAFKYCITIQH